MAEAQVTAEKKGFTDLQWDIKGIVTESNPVTWADQISVQMDDGPIVEARSLLGTIGLLLQLGAVCGEES